MSVMADLAVRYSAALLKAARQENALPVVTEEIQLLAREFSQWADVFYSPVFPLREQLATVDYVLGNSFHPLTKRFFCLLASMHRLGGIGKIADIFVKLALKEMKRIDLYITLYEEASPEMASELVWAACEKGLFDSQYRDTINLHISVDKSLLGGFFAECEEKIWDCSLRARLDDMAKVIRKI